MLDKSQWGYQEGNPSTVTEENNEPFYSENISECLDYQKKTGDYEPIENAIDIHRAKIENLTKEIQFLIDKARDGGLDYYANKLQIIKNKLNS